MHSRSWKFHLGRLILLAGLVVVLAFLTGYPTQVMLAAAVIYLAWQLANMIRLKNWLDEDDKDTPESLGAWSDIFDRISGLLRKNRKQKNRLEAVIEEFRSVTDAFPDAMLVLDEQNAITWFNDSARSLLGLRIPEDLGQQVTNFLREPDFANWISVAQQVTTPYDMPSPLDPNTYLSVSAVHYRDAQRLLILRDITEIHNLERIRRDFVANVSHELRTPLTVLLGYLESMHGQIPEDLEPAIDRMQDQATQMHALLNDLLELSRLQADQQESTEQNVDVPAITGQLQEQALEVSQGDHQFSFNIDPNLKLRGTPADLESAFGNLIQNAIHYTPQGGTIEVTWEQSDQGAIFRVSDSGIGIPARSLPRLTERFYRVKADRARHTGGTGLGLAIVKHVLNSHDARLQVESELGDGSIFTCLFPAERIAS